jgi:hypothetical protein
MIDSSHIPPHQLFFLLYSFSEHNQITVDTASEYRPISSDSMEQSHTWKASSRSNGQEIPNLLWNTKVYYRVKRVASGPYPEPD